MKKQNLEDLKYSPTGIVWGFVNTEKPKNFKGFLENCFMRTFHTKHMNKKEIYREAKKVYRVLVNSKLIEKIPFK